MKKQSRTIKFSLPTRVIDSNRDLKDFNPLFVDGDDQIALFEKEQVILEKGDYFVLDFGEEKCGGIRMLTSTHGPIHPTMKIHVRFGESVSEANSTLGENGSCNDHSMRDFIYGLPAVSDQMIGDTGFRFVRIDILEDSPVAYPIKAIYLYEYVNDYKRICNYHSEDQRLNDIFETCVHTLDLCLQNRIWDGIKRDRLVWIGDMEPEIHALLHLYGNIPEIEETIKTAELSNPMPLWINGIPSYSSWYLLITYDIYKYSKDKDYVLRHKGYLNEIIVLFNKSLDIDGNLDFSKAGLGYAMPYFIDWPTYREDNEQERKEAVTMLLQYIFPKVLEMYQDAGLDLTTINEILNKLNKSKVSVPQTKVFAAFYQLLHKDEKSYQILIKDGAKGFSTFMSYYLLKAIAQKDKEKAKELLKEYYGGMLSRGATSFWEDFHIEWLEGSSRIDELPKKGEKDLHGDFGDYCYKGFRHSLCHGWSAGPVSFLLEEDK